MDDNEKEVLLDQNRKVLYGVLAHVGGVMLLVGFLAVLHCYLAAAAVVASSGVNWKGRKLSLADPSN